MTLPQDQLLTALAWVFWLWIVGVLAQPLARRLFPDQDDRAYVAGKALGWLIVAFAPWLLASLGLISFSGSGPVFGVLALALIYALTRDPGEWPDFRLMLRYESLFLTLFVLGLATRLSAPDITGLEKFMDLGFMAASMRADAMPPEDMWFAGEAINYYYYGHAGAGLWSLLAGAPADHGYQLHMASLFALTGLLVFRLTAELTIECGRRLSTVTAGLATALVLFAGNFHSILYSVFRPLMGSSKPEFYYPDSTRFIGFDPPTEDKAFTEFVAYGLTVGDMHAHVLATPLAIFGVLLLLSMWRMNWRRPSLPWLHTICFGWLLGLCYMTNAWDFAIFGLFALLIVAMILIRHRGMSWRLLDRAAAAAIVALAVAAATAAPFITAFEPFASGVAMATARTPVWQLLALYGHVILAIAALLAMLAWRLDWREAERSFAAIIGAGCLILIAIPELVFVDDIYGADFSRANTMFKLAFRAQTLMQIAAAACIAYLAAGRMISFLAALALALPLVATFSYAEHTFKSPSVIASLNGMNFLQEEAEAVRFLRAAPLEQGEAFLEAGGESYTDAGRFAAMTGKPAVLGWRGHEWLWRSDPGAAAARLQTIERAYTGENSAPACALIRRHNIRYIVLGSVERDLYSALNEPMIRSLGYTVFENATAAIVAVRRERCER